MKESFDRVLISKLCYGLSELYFDIIRAIFLRV